MADRVEPPPSAPLSDDEAREAIPLKGAKRDLEAARRALSRWLAPRLGVTGRVDVTDIATPSGTGVANETLLFNVHWDGHSAPFVARVASDWNLYIEADIAKHAKMYEALDGVPGVPVPKVYGYEADPTLLGAPFFVMQRLPGLVPGDQPPWHSAGFVFDASPTDRRTMWENAVRTLAALHQVDASRFPFLAPGLAADLAYWRRYLDASYRGGQHDDLERGYEWLRHNLPSPEPTGISWGDSRFANILFDGTTVTGVLDWDTVSLAGAEADLAWWTHMDGPASALDGIGTPAELLTMWQALTGRTVQHFEYHAAYTSFRLGAILYRLFTHLGDDGILPPDVAREQANNSAQVQSLRAQLDALT